MIFQRIPGKILVLKKNAIGVLRWIPGIFGRILKRFTLEAFQEIFVEVLPKNL